MRLDPKIITWAVLCCTRYGYPTAQSAKLHWVANTYIGDDTNPITMQHTFENFAEAAECLTRLLPAGFAPEIGVICGSGLSSLQESVTGPRVEVPYSEIKGFPVSTGK